MVNWKFVQTQYKNIWVIVLVFGLILGALSGVGIFFQSFGNIHHTEGGIGDKRTIIDGGAWFFLNYFLFSSPGFIAPTFPLFFLYGLITSSLLINRDLNRGYIASWLTSSMSRKTIFNSKLFTFVSSILLLNFWMIFLEVFLYGIKMLDFSSVIGSLLVGNLSLMMLSILTGGIVWMIFCLFQKNGIAIGLSLGILGWFMLSYLLKDIQIGKTDLSVLKYFTIFSLVNPPLHYASNNSGIVGPEPIAPLKALNFAWQIPVMLIVGSGLLTGGQFVIKNKDFAF